MVWTWGQILVSLWEIVLDDFALSYGPQASKHLQGFERNNRQILEMISPPPKTPMWAKGEYHLEPPRIVGLTQHPNERGGSSVLRRRNEDKRPTELSAGYSCFLLSSGWSGYYQVARGTGLIISETPWPCRTPLATMAQRILCEDPPCGKAPDLALPGLCPRPGTHLWEGPTCSSRRSTMSDTPTGNRVC